MLSPVRLSVMFVHPTQAIKVFGNVSTLFGTRAISDPSIKKFKEIVTGKPLCRSLNRRGVAKYSDFGPFQGYISEMVQDRM